MTLLNSRAGLAAILAAVVTAPACQQTSPQRSTSEPGQLPGRTEIDRTPRLNATTYFAHGHLLERQGEFERAIAQYRKALELAPTFVSARNRLGITLNKMGQHSLASAEFRKVLETSPHLTYVQNNLGFSYYLEGKYELAEATLRDALSRKPSFPRARMNYGVVLGKLGRLREAFEQFRQAGSEADAYYNVALLQTEAGLYADAAQSLDTALRLNPRLEAARQQLRDVSRLAAAEQDRAPGTLAPAADVRTAAPPQRPAVVSADSTAPPDQSAEPQVAADIAPHSESDPAPAHRANPEPDPNTECERGEIRQPDAIGLAPGDSADAAPAPYQPEVAAGGSNEWTDTAVAPRPESELTAPENPFPEHAGEDADCDAVQRENDALSEASEELAAWLRELNRQLTELTGELGDRWCELREFLVAIASRSRAGDPTE